MVVVGGTPFVLDGCPDPLDDLAEEDCEGRRSVGTRLGAGRSTAGKENE